MDIKQILENEIIQNHIKNGDQSTFGLIFYENQKSPSNNKYMYRRVDGTLSSIIGEMSDNCLDKEDESVSYYVIVVHSPKKIGLKICQKCISEILMLSSHIKNDKIIVFETNPNMAAFIKHLHVKAASFLKDKLFDAFRFLQLAENNSVIDVAYGHKVIEGTSPTTYEHIFLNKKSVFAEMHTIKEQAKLESLVRKVQELVEDNGSGVLNKGAILYHNVTEKVYVKGASEVMSDNVQSLIEPSKFKQALVCSVVTDIVTKYIQLDIVHEPKNLTLVVSGYRISMEDIILLIKFGVVGFVYFIVPEEEFKNYMNFMTKITGYGISIAGLLKAYNIEVASIVVKTQK